MFMIEEKRYGSFYDDDGDFWGKEIFLTMIKCNDLSQHDKFSESRIGNNDLQERKILQADQERAEAVAAR